MDEKVASLETLSWVNSSNKNSNVIIAYMVICTLLILTLTLGFGHSMII